MNHLSPAVCGRSRFVSHGFLPRLGLAALLGLCAASTHAAELTTVSDKIPVKPADQRLHAALAKHKGQPVVINFWATWCEPCREEMPSLQRLADRWQSKGLTVITVTVADNTRQAEEFLQETGIKFTVLHDPSQSLSRPWGARILPTSLILDRRHQPRLRGQGAIDWDAPGIDQQLQALFK